MKRIPRRIFTAEFKREAIKLFHFYFNIAVIIQSHATMDLTVDGLFSNARRATSS